MGYRANFIIVENNKQKIYYSQEGALYTVEILAKGIAYCEKYFDFGFHETDWLIDNAAGEGGIVIDKDQNKILFYASGDIGFTPVLQRHSQKYIAKIWENWSVQWCSRGHEELAIYLGLMEDRILTEECKPNFFETDEWSPTMEVDRRQSDVITIINNGIIKDYKQDWILDGITICVLKGENLINLIPEELLIQEWQNELETTNCLLVDYDSKKLFVCWGSDADSRHDDEVRRLWPGWEVVRQIEGLIFHFDYTGRDRSIVEMTDKQFELYREEYMNYDFPILD